MPGKVENPWNNGFRDLIYSYIFGRTYLNKSSSLFLEDNLRAVHFLSSHFFSVIACASLYLVLQFLILSKSLVMFLLYIIYM